MEVDSDTGREKGTMGEALDAGMLRDKLVQVGNMPNERDRRRLIKNIADNFALEPEQAVALCGECHDSGSKFAAAVAVFDALEGDEKKGAFVKLAVKSLFKFAEDKKEFCDKLSWDYVEETEEVAPPSGHQVSKFDNKGQHSVSGYAA